MPGVASMRAGDEDPITESAAGLKKAECLNSTTAADSVGGDLERYRVHFAGAPQRIVGYLDTAARDSEGRLWFVTRNGVVRHDPERSAAASHPLIVTIRSMFADGAWTAPVSAAPFTVLPRFYQTRSFAAAVVGLAGTDSQHHSSGPGAADRTLMRARFDERLAERIGAEFTVVSGPGTGTAITLIVPGRTAFRSA